MKIYKLRVKPKASQITPWHSDTILGSLCWIYVQKEGEAKLKELFNLYDNEQFPFVVSEAFPEDLIVKPMAGNLFSIDKSAVKEQALNTAEKAKKAKKIDLLNIEEFNTIINGGQVQLIPKAVEKEDVGVMHNQINRLTGATVDGGLYEQHETFWGDGHLSIYAGVEDKWLDRLYNLFEQLSLRGIGKRASVGKGAFDIIDFVEFTGFKIPDQPNCFVSLSNYIPKKTDPVQGQYKIHVKYGKLGQAYAHADNPFKKPLLMLKPGAVFWTDKPQHAYGRLVYSVSDTYPEVVQIGSTLAIPARLQNPDI